MTTSGASKRLAQIALAMPAGPFTAGALREAHNAQWPDAELGAPLVSSTVLAWTRNGRLDEIGLDERGRKTYVVVNPQKLEHLARYGPVRHKQRRPELHDYAPGRTYHEQKFAPEAAVGQALELGDLDAEAGDLRVRFFIADDGDLQLVRTVDGELLWAFDRSETRRLAQFLARVSPHFDEE